MQQREEEGEEKKTILYIVTKGGWGGAQRYVFDLAVEASKREYEPVVAFGDDGLLAERLRAHGIATARIPSLKRNINLFKEIRSFFGIMRIIRAKRPSIVHINSSKAGGLGALAARILGVKKIVFTVHGWPFWEQRSTVVRAGMWFFSWLTALLSHHVICISDFDLRVARNMQGVRKKAVRIYNGIAPINFLPKTQRAHVEVLTSGELNHNKNLFAAIDAVIAARTRGADISYSIMSEGELRSELERYIRERDASSFISLLGFIPNAARQYTQYDIFFLPSRKEGVPYVLLEAGMAGLAAVASDVGGIPEIIEDGTSGILKSPTDVEGFAEALAQLAKDAHRRAQLGDALKKKVERTFSLDRMITETMALYETWAQ